MKRAWIIMAATASAMFGGGCALRHGDYALDGKLRIELSPPTGPLFYGIQVDQRADELIVSGFGRRSRTCGHVEVSVVGPDGGRLANVRAAPLPPRAVPNRSYNYRFEASLPVVAPPGSTLCIAYALADDPGDTP